MTKDESSTINPETLMLAYLCIKGENGLNQQVEILDRFGLTDAQIAQICGAAVQSIRNARARNKKAKKDA
jgi:hypothetical protein